MERDGCPPIVGERHAVLEEGLEDALPDAVLVYLVQQTRDLGVVAIPIKGDVVCVGRDVFVAEVGG